MYSIQDIAALITEDPDIYCDYVLTEADAKTYLNAFNRSQVKVPFDWIDGGPDGTPVQLSDLSIEHKLELIQRIQSVVDPALARYEQYFVRQVATGALSVAKIEEDAERLNNTIKLFIVLSRKAAWTGSKNILDFKNWRELERTVREFEEKHIEYDASADAETLFKKSYPNNVMSLLLGGPPEVYTYWFRVVTSPEAAAKYGKGTMWCTSSTPAARGTPQYDQHYFHHYHKQGGVYIIELQTPNTPRRPVFQISGDERMDPEDTPVSRFGPRLANFVRDVLRNSSDKIHPNTVNGLEELCGTLEQSS